MYNQGAYLTERRRIHCFFAALLAACSLSAATADNNPAKRVEIDKTYGRIPLHLELNEGQADSSAKYLARGSGYSMYLTEAGVVFALRSGEGSALTDKPRAAGLTNKLSILRMKLLGANKTPKMSSERELPTRVNYFSGSDPSKWRTNVATFGQVRYREVYPGVDWVVYGNQQELEYDFIVAPGSNPKKIRFRVEGTRRYEIDAQGNLLLHTQDGILKQKRPVAYQIINGIRHEVEVEYRIVGREVRFQLGRYNKQATLVIDPVLVYSTYLGRNRAQYIYGMTLDSVGKLYICGATESAFTNITAGAFQTNYLGHTGFDGTHYGDSFVGKLNTTGTAFEYLTYLAGNHYDNAWAITVDGEGAAYVTGTTWSKNFPLQNPIQSEPGDPDGDPGTPERTDAFVTKLNATGTALLYSTRLGGEGFDHGYDIKIDGTGSAYVVGTTEATDFPTTNSFQPTNKGGYDVFVARLNAAGSSLVFSTYMGGKSDDGGYGLVLDSTNAIYTSGWTASTNYPVTNAVQAMYGGGDHDAFVTKISATGTNLVYSTYMGGKLDDYAAYSFVDSSGGLYICGNTTSTNFPTTNALQRLLGGTGNSVNSDGFLAKLTPGGNALEFSTFLGGINTDTAQDVRLDATGNIIVTGKAGSVDFAPYANYGSINSGGGDGFVAKLNTNGSVLLNFAYLGGTGEETCFRMGIDDRGNVVVVGSTESSNFPISSSNVVQAAFGGTADGFISKLYFARDELGTEVSLSRQTSGAPLNQPFGPLVSSNNWTNISLTTVVSSNGPAPRANTRFQRGTSGDLTFTSFVLPLDFEQGVKLDDVGDNTNKFNGDRPWFTRLLKDTRRHLSLSSTATNAGGWRTNTFNYLTNFQNPIVAFGSDAGASPLYVNQNYRFGVYAGAQYESTNSDGTVFQAPLRILVYRKSDFVAGQTNIVSPIATNLITIPRRTIAADQAAWNQFASNGWTITIETNGLRTTVQLVEERTSTWGVTPQFSNTRNGPYLLTHKATLPDNCYVIESIGVVPVGTNVYPMVTNSTGGLDWCKLYALEFDNRLPWRSVFIDQPHFDGKPLPPAYQGKTVQELTNLAARFTTSMVLTNAGYTNLDTSPELRRHPILDKFVADMGNDPLALANYVFNQIELTDALSYNETTGQASAPAVNHGGINRGALGTLLEGQGSPTEQCALLIYLLRQAGYPAAYVFPTNRNLQLLDTRLSRLLRMQVRAAVNDRGELYTSNALITVNYPWVAVNISNTCVHLLPWLKDTEVVEGYNLYDMLGTNYDNGDKWFRRYISGDTNIMSLSTESDAPSVLFLKFLKKSFLDNYPGLSVDDVGTRSFNRRNNYARWQDFPVPNLITNEAQVVAVDSLASATITNVSPAMTNVFNTVSIEVYSLANTNNRLVTGPLRVADLHNRRMLVATNSSTNLMLWLAPFRSDNTNQGSFSGSDLALTNKQVLNLSLATNESQFAVRMTHQRHRAINFDPAPETYLGVSETLSFTISDRPFTRADVTALCLNVGRVTPPMLDIHARAYAQMDYQRSFDTNSIPLVEDYQGAAAFLMGMDYYGNVSRFVRANEQLHKTHVVSWFAQGLSKLTPIKLGAVTLVRPSLDMFFNEVAHGANATLRPDAGNDFLNATDDFSRILTAEIAAQEHNLINGYYRSTNAVSAVTLLRLAQQRAVGGAVGIIELNKNNYLTRGETNSPGYGPNKLKDSDPEIWAAVTNAFQSWDSDYVRAFITPGPVAVPAAAFRGVGLVILGKSQSASLISFNMNGAMGEPSSFFGDTPTALSADIQAASSLDYTFSNGGFDSSANYNAFNNNGNLLGGQQSSFIYVGSRWYYLYGPYGYRIALRDYARQRTFSTFTSPSQIDLARQVNELYYFPSTISASESLTRSLERGNVGPSTWKKVANYVGDPVNVINGEFYHTAVDLHLPGPMPLELRRNYSSQDQSDRNNFGYGWKINFVPYLTVATNTNATATVVISAAELDGSVIAYRQQTNDLSLFLPVLEENPHLDNDGAEGMGSIHNRFNAQVRLSTNGANVLYTLTGPDGSTRVFKVASFPLVSSTNVVTRERPYLQSWRDNRGNTCTFSYGTNSVDPEYGQLVRIQCSNGSFIGLNYNVGGYVIEAFTGDGRRVRYQYDDFGDLTRVVLPDASEELYEYLHTKYTNNAVVYLDSTHLLAKEIKPSGRILENFYDSQRRVAVQKATVGNDLKTYTNAVFTYANNFSLTNMKVGVTGNTQIKDVNNNITRYDYTNSLVTKIDDPVNPAIVQEWYYTNGPSGAYQRSLKSRTNTRGLKAAYVYDSLGNVTNVTLTGGLSGSGPTNETAISTFTYNSNNLVLTVSDPAGNRRVFYYDSNFVFLPAVVVTATSNTWVSSNRFDFYSVSNGTLASYGLLKRVTRAVGSPDSAEIEFLHDERGFPIRVVHYTGTSDQNVTNFLAFNSRGELFEQADAANRTNRFEYDARGNVKSSEVWDSGARVAWEFYYYNANGQLTWTDGPRFDPEDYTWRDYDGDGRLTQLMRWRSQGKSDGTGVEAPAGDDLYSTSFFEYDKFGNQTRSINPRGIVTTNTFDAIGQLTGRKVLDTNGATLTSEGFAYEPGGLVTIATNALGGLTQTLYNGTGQPRFRKNADGSTNAWRYYVDGRLKREILHNGSYWETTYNDDARITTRIFYSAANVALATNAVESDRRGNIVRIVDEGGFVSTNRFDGLDRIKVAAGPAIVSISPTNLPSFSGGASGPITSIVQQVSTYLYDSAGKVLTVSNALKERITTTRDALGRVVRSEIFGSNGVSVRLTSTAYAANHHSFTTTNGSGAAAIISTTYTDNDGNAVLSLRYPSANVVEFDWQAFDVSGNSVASQHTSRTNSQLYVWSTNGWTFDGLNRVKTATVGDGATTTFSYNAGGNLTNRAMPGGVNWRATYNAAGQPLKEYDIGTGNLASRTNSYSYYASNSIYAGLLQTLTDGRLVTRTFTYDDWLRATTNTYTGASNYHNLTTITRFDARGLATNITESFATNATGTAVAIRRSFDAYRQLISEQFYTNNVLASSVQQSWDSGGRRFGLGYSGFAYNFGWRADGLLTASLGLTGGGSYGYDDAGLLTARNLGPKVTSILSRDGTGRPLSIDTSVDGETKLDETLSYTGDGLVGTHIVDRVNVASAFTDNRAYTYANFSRRLTEERVNLSSSKLWTNSFLYDNGSASGPGVLTRSGAPNSGLAQWSGIVDGLSRMTNETNNVIRRLAHGKVNGPATITASIDGQPMPLTVVGTGNAIWTNQWRVTMELTPGAHQLTATARHPSGQFTTNAAVWFTNNASAPDRTEDSYDLSGNVTRRIWRSASGATNRTQTLSWDGRGRLYKVVERDGQTNGFDWTPVYDPLGRKLRTVEIPVTNNVSLTAQALVIEQYFDPQVRFMAMGVSVAGKTTWKLMGPDMDGSYGGLQGRGGFDAIIPGPELFCPTISDARGNVLAVYDVTHGSISWNQSRPTGYGAVPAYRPPPLGRGADLVQASAFAGVWSDVTGYYWRGNRYYDSVAGRWLTSDPLGHDGGPNLFTYANGDPINFDDPDGLVGRATFQLMQDMGNSVGRLASDAYFSVGYAGVYPFSPATAERYYGASARSLVGTGVGLGQLAYDAAAYPSFEALSPFMPEVATAAYGPSLERLDRFNQAFTGGQGNSAVYRTTYTLLNAATFAFAGEGQFGRAGRMGDVGETIVNVERAGPTATASSGGQGLIYDVNLGTLAEMEAQTARIHGVLDPFAQSRRTTAVLETSNGRFAAGGSGRDLSGAQIGVAEGLGLNAARMPGFHAEFTALSEAWAQGATPEMMTVSRNICSTCQANLAPAQPMFIGNQAVVFPRETP